MTKTDSLASHETGCGRPRSVVQAGHLRPVPCPWNKRALDVALSGVGILLSAPLWVLFAAAMKLQDGGPVFYAQDRIGEGSRIFKALKFRSMVPDAEAGVGAMQATKDDPRMTPVGRLLRAAAVDELPQLWNIFRGDMSFVGPRALRLRESDADRPGEVVLEILAPRYRADEHRLGQPPVLGTHVGGNSKFPIRGNRKPHTLVVGGLCPAFHDVGESNSEGAGGKCTDGRRGCC